MRFPMLGDDVVWALAFDWRLCNSQFYDGSNKIFAARSTWILNVGFQLFQPDGWHLQKKKKKTAF